MRGLLFLQFDEAVVHSVQLGRKALDLGLQSADLSGRQSPEGLGVWLGPERRVCVGTAEAGSGGRQIE
jgi:hypothetical protein